ncbi:TPA: polysaccharide biosynthesis C-terminal domain-containing protein [Vibrio parahaemolyticus]|nr:polysaccharide biosynthesis C-terminal domain-containing protein [Vibrio parahaemolyticus]
MIFSILDKLTFAVFALSSHFILAKFLDIEIYGKYIYIQAILYITIQFCGLGIKNIYIKKHVEKVSLIKLSSIILKGMSFFIFMVIYLITYYITGDESFLYVSVLLLPSMAYILDQYEWDNEIKSKFKDIFYIRCTSLFISMIVRLWLLYIDSDFFWLLLLYVLELPICYFIQLFYTQKNKSVIIEKIKINELIKCSQDLLNASWPILAALLLAMIYNRIDQIMIKNIIGDAELALYGISVKFTEPFNIFVTGIISYLYPKFVMKKNKESNIDFDISKWFYFILISGIFISGAIVLIFGNLLVIFFGEEYSGAKDILQILALNIPLMFVGIYINNILVLNNLQRLIFTRSIIGCITNIILNIVLIPNYGGVGAAIATLITMLLINFIYYFMSKKTRTITINCISGVFNK